jgi:hypothetical protein
VEEEPHWPTGPISGGWDYHGTGTFTRSLEVTETWTYWTIQRTDGTSYREGNGVIMTKDRNEMATATGHGEGRMME